MCLYTISPQGENTLTGEKRMRDLSKVLLGAERLDRIQSDYKCPSELL